MGMSRPVIALYAADNLCEDDPVDFTSRVDANSETDADSTTILFLQRVAWVAWVIDTVVQRVI